MGALERSVASLRVFGDSLNPDEITRLLGHEPTHSHRKGDPRQTARSGTVWRTGGWRLVARDREPEELDAQIFELLDGLTSDREVWTSISKRFRVDLFVGLFMASSNDGLNVSPDALSALGSRGIELSLDIYDPVDEQKSAAIKELLRSHPIQSPEVLDWCFRCEEVVNGVYRVEGRDVYGHLVSKDGDDPDALLTACVADARRIEGKG